MASAPAKPHLLLDQAVIQLGIGVLYTSLRLLPRRKAAPLAFWLRSLLESLGHKRTAVGERPAHYRRMDLAGLCSITRARALVLSCSTPASEMS
jgi:hypothetical protein